MTKDKAIIKNNAGIHVRPSGIIIGETKGYIEKILLTVNKISVELNSVMSLLTLGMIKNDEIEIEVTGDREKEVCSLIKELLEREYDFPQERGNCKY